MALARIDYDHLRAYPTTPRLYQSGVRYYDDSHIECWQNTCRVQEDHWQDVQTCLLKGYADCEDLCCWLVAQYWLDDIAALPFPVRQASKGAQLWHIQVLLPDGTIEDPSLLLGMNQANVRYGIVEYGEPLPEAA
jgi:hypothetical protein